MLSQERRGLSPEQFVTRIENSESVVHNWPFGHMVSDTYYPTQYSPADHIFPETDKALVVGTLGMASRSGVRLTIEPEKGTHLGPSYHGLELSIEDDQQMRAWQQMAGVNVALAIELGETRPFHSASRDAQVTRVLGIEQPLYPPNSTGGYRTGRGARSEGFVQGRVLEDTTPSHSYDTRLDFGRRTANGSLICNYASIVGPDGWRANASPQAGNEIRARAMRTHQPRVFRQTEATVYILPKPQNR